ncbi:hypothetical protein [Actinophytocola sediminis]
MLAYGAGSFPPRVYLPLALAWSVGASGATALTDTRVTAWVPDLGVLVSVASMVVVLLVLRALDDLRDLDYDREHNPGRPLAAGVVATRDLITMIVAGSVLVLALNSWRWPVLCVLAGLLAYAFLIVWVDNRFGWPSGDAMFVGLMVNVPIQLLTNTFLYAAVLYPLDLGLSWSGMVGVLAATMVFLHVEFARKTTRLPRPGERTYVTVVGVTGTSELALACAAGSAVLLVATTRPWTAGVLFMLLPLVFPLAAALRFARDRSGRWSYGLAAGFVLTAYVTLAVVSLLAGEPT